MILACIVANKTSHALGNAFFCSFRVTQWQTNDPKPGHNLKKRGITAILLRSVCFIYIAGDKFSIKMNMEMNISKRNWDVCITYNLAPFTTIILFSAYVHLTAMTANLRFLWMDLWSRGSIRMSQSVYGWFHVHWCIVILQFMLDNVTYW